MTRAIILSAVVVVLTCSAAEAGQIVVTSYDMLNGDGNAQGGAFNYWDGNYNGSGCATCDNAPLTGGVGALTDGVIATQRWDSVSNEQGTGQYVGWNTAYTGNPSITFNFGGSRTINTLDVYVDNSLFGGVQAPGTLLIDGNPYAFTSTAISPYADELTISGLNLAANSLTLTATPGGLEWIFISEVQFYNNSVPEPGTFALFGTALLALGALTIRRKSA
jgi:hypothetical protein